MCSSDLIRTGTTTTSFSYAICDPHGTPSLYLDNTAQNPTWRQYSPYGGPRGTPVPSPDNRGFLNKAMDGATGLTIVGARQYDPDTGRFITLDPVLETGDPTQLNGYGYAGNNPVTHADPTGLRTDYNGDASDTAYSSGKAPVQNVTYPHPLDRHEAVRLHHQYLTPHDVDDRHAARIRAGAARHTYAPNTDYKAPVPDTSAPTSHHASKGFYTCPPTARTANA